MENPPSFRNDPRRLAAEKLLHTLFSPDFRQAAEVLRIALQLENHPGIGFFRLPVPYTIQTHLQVLGAGLSETMQEAVHTIIADLQALPPEMPVILNIDETRIPKVQPG